jgi:archaellum component FlaF (FlaF/FlaG flagellin family)
MKQTSINLLGLFSAFALTCLATSYSAASTVEITYENSGTSVNNAGLHKLTLDGVSTFAMNAKSKTIRPGRTWTATVNY